MSPNQTPSLCLRLFRQNEEQNNISTIWVVFGRLTTHRGRTQDRFWRFFRRKKIYSKIFSVPLLRLKNSICSRGFFVVSQKIKSSFGRISFTKCFWLGKKILTRFFRFFVHTSPKIALFKDSLSIAFFPREKRKKEIHP